MMMTFAKDIGKHFLLSVHVVGKVNGTSFDDREVQFPLGEGTEHNIPEGLERALERFKKGEKSTIKLAPKVSYLYVMCIFRSKR